MPSTASDPAGLRDPVRDPLLDSAEYLFYERGFQAVGMDEVRSAAGLPLKRIYALYPGKEALAVAMLDRRDRRWHADLGAYVDRFSGAEERVLAVFDWLSEWLAGPGHRGCAWINAFGELGGTSEDITAAVRRHKRRFRDYVTELVRSTGSSVETAEAVILLAEGCLVTAGITGTATPATHARSAVRRLLEPPR
ncbi:TetR/AcrR family transcriptional regulator [Ruania halotolerans]|uniref:TetR/AcrR family transcriptional regulator n=1 Tax=Ruania halotolerans TaxID=2897773 RepID=UPI001E408A0C|nr:TetR/AcrR family transcriptional regulator [Ruania halotolerans]UFU05423.1 TetR/AcrR family transcriptional regulator [Ruania halotolerans]